MKIEFTKDELAVIMAGVSLLLNTVYKNPQDLKLKDDKSLFIILNGNKVMDKIFEVYPE